MFGYVWLERCRLHVFSSLDKCERSRYQETRVGLTTVKRGRGDDSFQDPTKPAVQTRLWIPKCVYYKYTIPSGRLLNVSWLVGKVVFQVDPHEKVAAIPCSHWSTILRLLHASQPLKQNPLEWLRVTRLPISPMHISAIEIRLREGPALPLKLGIPDTGCLLSMLEALYASQQLFETSS